MKNKLIFLFQFLSFALIFFVLSCSSIQGLFYPFAFAMLFALAWSGQKVWLLAPAYIVGLIINNHSFAGIICIVSTVTLLAIPYYLHILCKKPMKKWELFIFAGISQSAHIVFGILNQISPLFLALCPPFVL